MSFGTCVSSNHSQGGRWVLSVCGAIVGLLVAGAALAVPQGREQKSTLEDQESISITIYNSDLGLVKDVRNLRTSRGVLNLNFEGVAGKIDPTSVHIRSLNHPGHLAVLEQNFEFDLISPAKLMEKYLGRDMELVMWRNGEEVTVPARLIGNQGGLVYEMNGKIAVNPSGRPVLPELPEGLISKPTLVWMLDSDRREHEVEASYLTSGISWKSNYVLVLSKDDKKIDLSGWVTINNQSGATYADASIKLVAGDVNRAQPERGVYALDEVYSRRGGVSAPAQFVEKAFFEYHLYTLQRKSTIKNAQTKQISLLAAENASVEKKYVYQAAVPYWFAAMTGPDKGTKIGVFLSFDNSKKNNLGMPLPKGVVRVYKRDHDDALQFIGEDRIDHTPEDETIRVKMGEAFDVVGERVQTRFKILQSGHLYESSYKVELRNHKDEPITVSVVEVIPSDWEVLEKSHDYEQESSNRIRFDVPVDAKGATELTYTVRVKY